MNSDIKPDSINPVDYFYNEKGDYTITLHDNPVLFTKDEKYAVLLKNAVSALTLRIDILSKMEMESIYTVKRLKEALVPCMNFVAAQTGIRNPNHPYAVKVWEAANKALKSSELNKES